jgi:hypothetical protein
MSRPGIKPGPPAWEASTLQKNHLDSLCAGYSEPLLMLRLALHPDLYSINDTNVTFSQDRYSKCHRCQLRQRQISTAAYNSV